MRKNELAVAAISCLMVAWPAAATGSQPKDVVTAAVEALVAIPDNLTEAERAHQVRQIMLRYGDHQRLAEIVLEPFAAGWSEAQRRDTARALAGVLLPTTTRDLLNHRPLAVETGDEEVRSSRAQVRCRAATANGSSALAFVLELRQGSWRIVDYAIDGAQASRRFQLELRSLLAHRPPGDLVPLFETRARELYARAPATW